MVQVPGSSGAGREAAPLVRESVLVAMPAAHRLAALETVDVRQLRGETFIFFKPGRPAGRLGAGHRAGRVRAPREFQTSSHNRLLALVNEGLGVTFVPASAASDPPPPAVVVRPTAPALDRTVGVVWRADHRHTPAASAFLALLRQRASLED